MSSDYLRPMDKRLLGGILLIALLHGLIYVFIVPPWQHYDEPSHFEYAWRLASERGLPNEGTVDLSFRRELVESMIDHDFYHGLPAPALEMLTTETIVSGLQYSQLTEPPLYYVSVSIPILILRKHSLAIQLYGGRLISLSFFLLTILAVWGFTRELTVPGSSLRFLVPFSAALLPGFVDLMTAVNNDVGAVTVFSWFLWGSVRLLRRGVSVWNISWVLSSALVSLLTKSTAFMAIPLSGFVMGLAIWDKRGGKLVWIGFGVLGFLSLLFAFTWDDAASWHRATLQDSPTRIKSEKAPTGEHVLQIDLASSTNSSWLYPLYQPFSANEVNRLRGKTLTFGVWMWISTQQNEEISLDLHTPTLNTGQVAFSKPISVGTAPAYYAFHWVLPPDSTRFWITIDPRIRKAETIVYYDGIVLTEGNYPLTVPPELDDSGSQGTWGESPFYNLVKNPSGEHSWLAFRPLLDKQLSLFLPEDMSISMLLSGLLDWKRTGWYFGVTSKNLIETFWARFGWGNVPLIWPAGYSILSGIVYFGLAGAGISLIRRRRMPGKAWIFLGFVLVLIWGGALLRGEIYIFAPSVFIPSARYAFPAIGPTLLLLFTGYLEWTTLIKDRISRPPHVDHSRILSIFAGIFFLILDGIAILSVINFYEKV